MKAHRFVFALVFAAALAPTALADEDEASTRFHSAYVLEVIEGKVAEAARLYLELAKSETTPADLRAEARFRLAVCSALLGRPDEARSMLVLLREEPATSAVLRARAEEYLRTLSGVGVGSELDRKLEALLFELGRASPDTSELAVYRDFEILGERVRPFLRRLLGHEDARVRAHAFRLLVRAGEPGMASKWWPWLAELGEPFDKDLVRYLQGWPEELATFEKRLLELDDATLAKVLQDLSPPPAFSLEFSRKAYERAPALGVRYVPGETVPEELPTLLRAWILATDSPRALGAAVWALKWQGSLPPSFFDEAVFGRLLELAAVEPLEGWERHIQSVSDRMPAPVLLEAFGRLLESAATEGKERSWLRRAVAEPLERKPPGEVDLAAYARRVEEWLRLPEADTREQGHAIGIHLRHVLRHLPAEAARATARRIAESNDLVQRPPLHGAFRLEAPEDVPAFLGAFDGASEEERRQLIGMLPQAAEVWLQVVPTLLPELDVRWASQLVNGWTYRARKADPAVAAASADALLGDLARRQPPERATLYRALFPHGVVSDGTGMHTAWAGLFTTIRAVFERRWQEMTGEDRRVVLSSLYRQLESPPEPGLVSFLRAHLGEPGTDWQAVAARPSEFPLVEWLALPRADARVIEQIPSGIAQEEVDAAARALGARPERSFAVLRFVVRRASGPVVKEVLSAWLADPSPDVRYRVTDWLSQLGSDLANVDPDTLERALEVALAGASAGGEGRPPSAVVPVLAESLKRRRPTAALIPAARFLIHSEDRQAVLSGIALAQSLGRVDLVEDLKALLGSLDETVRTSARGAMVAIDELESLRHR